MQPRWTVDVTFTVRADSGSEALIHVNESLQHINVGDVGEPITGIECVGFPVREEQD